MSKVKANISEIQNFATKIDEQIDELEEIKTLVSGFVDKAQEAANQERTKLTKAIAHANNVISEAQKKVDEIQEKIDEIEDELSVTPSTITITETDEDGNETTRVEPNPEYERLLSRLNREISRLDGVEAIIASLEATIAECEGKLSMLDKSQESIEQNSEEIILYITNWQGIARDAVRNLNDAAELLDEYLKERVQWSGSGDADSGSRGGSSRAPKEHRDDNGQVYRVGNDLIKNGTYTVNGYTYETDEQGRILSASGKLRLKNGERSNIKDTIQSVGRGSEHEGDDRGHIIGDRFDGSNGLENMFPQNSTLNRGKYNKFEKELADAVADGKEVYVKIDLLYGTNTNRPTQVLAIATVDGKQEIWFFDND